MAFKRLMFGAAVGYVLGARSGEKRYKQLKAAWQKFREWGPVDSFLSEGQEIARVRTRELVRRVRGGAGEESEDGSARGPEATGEGSRRSQERERLDEEDADRAEDREPERRQEAQQGEDRGERVEDQDRDERVEDQDEAERDEDQEEADRSEDHDSEQQYEVRREIEPGSDEAGGDESPPKGERSRRGIGERVGALARAAWERGRVS
jgi:hypothetical protein